jgi:putative PIN family toxin of toxin-antitoxin system
VPSVVLPPRLPNKRPLRAVIDTNTWIRFLLHPGSIKPFWESLVSRQYIVLLLSRELLEEIGEILLRYEVDPAEFAAFCRGLLARKQAEIIGVTSQITDCEDRDDNFLLELVIDGSADLLVSGDRHLLAFRPAYGGARILTYEEFRQWRQRRLRLPHGK